MDHVHAVNAPYSTSPNRRISLSQNPSAATCASVGVKTRAGPSLPPFEDGERVPYLGATRWTDAPRTPRADDYTVVTVRHRLPSFISDALPKCAMQLPHCHLEQAASLTGRCFAVKATRSFNTSPLSHITPRHLRIQISRCWSPISSLSLTKAHKRTYWPARHWGAGPDAALAVARGHGRIAHRFAAPTVPTRRRYLSNWTSDIWCGSSSPGVRRDR